MIGRFLAAAVAVGTVVATAVLAAPAAAQADTWTVTPGGQFDVGGPAVILVDGGDVQWTCDTVGLAGTTKSGSGLANPLFDFPAAGGLQFGNCQGPFGLALGVTQVGDWHLVCDSYDGDVAHCRIVGVVIDISAPGCAARITGDLDVTYTNSTGVFRILPNYTLTVSYVDPASNCLGLIAEGQHAVVDAEFVLDPPMTITSP